MWTKSCVIKNNTLRTLNHKAVIRVCRLHILQYEMNEFNKIQIPDKPQLYFNFDLFIFHGLA